MSDDAGVPGSRSEHEQAAQRDVDAVFDTSAEYWRDIYTSDDFYAVVYRRRRDLALAWTSPLADGSGQRALDVGCGAGLLTVGLAQQGFAVDAIDSSDAMLELATRAVADAGHAGAVELRTADVHALPWPDETFAVVVALGVVPWLHAPEAALAEMARVTRRGGHVIVSSDNSLGLSNLLEPRLSAPIAPVRRALTAILRALRLKSPQTVSERRFTPRRFDRMLAANGLVKLRGTTLGFGRFTFFGWRLLSERRSRALDARLQRAADRPRPIVRTLGNQYLVLTTRP